MSRPLSPSQLQLIQRKRAEAAMRLSQHQKNPGSRQQREATPHADAHGRGGSAAGDWKSIWDGDFDHSGNDPPETTLPPKHVIVIIAGPPALLLSCHERVRTQEGGLLGEVMEVVRWDDGGMICSVQLADGTLIDGSAIPGQTFCRA